MKTLKMIAAASVIAVAGSTASAGGLAPTASAPEVVIPVPTPTTAAGSVPSSYIVLGLLAALVAASGSF